jgi:hypothetical protein
MNTYPPHLPLIFLDLYHTVRGSSPPPTNVLDEGNRKMYLKH